MYGILRDQTNTGSDAELIAVFTAPLSIRSKSPTMVSDTLSLRRKSTVSTVQRWEIESGIAPTQTPAELLVSNAVNGSSRAFFIRFPQTNREPHAFSQALHVLNAAAAGSTSVDITDTKNAILRVGDFISFEGHTKVYIVTASTKAAYNKNTVTLFPPLTNAVDAEDAVNYGAKVTMPVMYSDTEAVSIRFQDGVLAGLDTVSLVEAL